MEEKYSSTSDVQAKKNNNWYETEKTTYGGIDCPMELVRPASRRGETFGKKVSNLSGLANRFYMGK